MSKLPTKEIICAALGGYLLFFCQPITGRLLTPSIGGSPTGWLLVMLWFQGSLLLGNLICLSLQKLQTKTQVLLLSLACTAILTQVFDFQKIPEQSLLNPTGIFNFLWSTVGLQAVILGMVTATMANLARSKNLPAKHVIMASNVGAFTGLWASIGAEVTIPLQTAQTITATGWIALLMATIICLRKPGQTTTPQKDWDTLIKESVPVLKIGGLAALGCGILVATTEMLCQDIGSTPIGWAPPLTVFLASYILAFSSKFTSSKLRETVTRGSLILIIAVYLQQPTPTIVLLLPLLIFFPLWTLHSKIAELQPKTPKAQAKFTTAISLGGLLGSLTLTLLSPTLLSTNHDLLILCVITLFISTKSKMEMTARKLWIPTTCFLLTILAANYLQNVDQSLALLFILGVFASTTILIPSFLPLGATILLLGNYCLKNEGTLQKNRNLFGTMIIKEEKKGNVIRRSLLNGTTLHGFQLLDASGWDTTPTSYYSPEGPLGDLVCSKKNSEKKILVIGLGTGTIAGYKGNEITFIEIDPKIIQVAKEEFNYLTPETKIIQGDGRQVTSTLNEKFDLIILDAFSSDSIPSHLITTEALETFAEKLEPNGQIAVHISNRFYNLQSLLSRNAQDIGLHAFNKSNQEKDKQSQWVCIQQKDQKPAPGWTKPNPSQYPLKDYQGSLLHYFKIWES